MPPIRDMFNGFLVRDAYIDELINSKRQELERNEFQLDGSGFVNNSFLNLIVNNLTHPAVLVSCSLY